MSDGKLNWPMNSVEEMTSWAGEHTSEYDEIKTEGAEKEATLAKLEYMEAIAQVLIEIRDELRKMNEKGDK